MGLGIGCQEADLPEAPFAVQLDADDPPRGAPEERTTVLVDLRPAGAVADADDLEVIDPETFEPGPDLFTPGFVIEDGFPWVLMIDLLCSVDVIGPLNGVMWRAVEPALGPGEIPDGWGDPAAHDQVEAEFLLSSDPAGLTITVDGVSLTIASLTDDGVRIAVIPHTLQVTTLSLREVGDGVNLEADVLGRWVKHHVERMLADRGA